jgi:hypothetical protein
MAWIFAAAAIASSSRLSAASPSFPAFIRLSPAEDIALSAVVPEVLRDDAMADAELLMVPWMLFSGPGEDEDVRTTCTSATGMTVALPVRKSSSSITSTCIGELVGADAEPRADD